MGIDKRPEKWRHVAPFPTGHVHPEMEMDVTGLDTSITHAPKGSRFPSPSGLAKRNCPGLKRSVASHG
uniref:Uncharacterized protein n=1 Tax=Arundo donax TaxID=35708 RepID=A0A0A8YYI6_ARUDO